jgi:hypothetical protein
MNELLLDFAERLSSRKFLVAVFGLASLMFGWVPVESQYQFVIMLVGYIAGESAVDFAERR